MSLNVINRNFLVPESGRKSLLAHFRPFRLVRHFLLPFPCLQTLKPPKRQLRITFALRHTTLDSFRLISLYLGLVEYGFRLPQAILNLSLGTFSAIFSFFLAAPMYSSPFQPADLALSMLAILLLKLCIIALS